MRIRVLNHGDHGEEFGKSCFPVYPVLPVVEFSLHAIETRSKGGTTNFIRGKNAKDFVGNLSV